MKKIISFFLSSLVISLFLVSCNCEDISGWVPEPISAQLIGYVHFEDNTPVANATIEVIVNGKTYTTTTDADGFYRIEQIDAGDGTASVSYPSNPDITGSTKIISLDESKVNECNFLLIKTQSVMTVEDDMYQVYLPDIIQEDKSVTQIATFYIPAGTMEEDDDLSLSAFYELEPGNSTVTKATTIPQFDSEGYEYTGMDVIITVESKSKKGNSHSIKPFLIEIQELMSPISVTNNGKEVDYEVDKERGVSFFYTNEFGICKFRYPIYVKETVGQKEYIKSFTPSEFASSGKSATVIEAEYERKWGVEIDWNEQEPTFLWQYVKLILGGDELATINERYYNPNVTIPAGEILVLSGYQTYVLLDFKCEWAHVYVKQYNGITVEMKDRKHTGGSN